MDPDPFGVVSEVGLGMGVLDFGGDRRRGRGSFCNQWGICDALFSNYFKDLFSTDPKIATFYVFSVVAHVLSNIAENPVPPLNFSLSGVGKTTPNANVDA